MQGIDSATSRRKSKRKSKSRSKRHGSMQGNDSATSRVRGCPKCFLAHPPSDQPPLVIALSKMLASAQWNDISSSHDYTSDNHRTSGRAEFLHGLKPSRVNGVADPGGAPSCARLDRKEPVAWRFAEPGRGLGLVESALVDDPRLNAIPGSRSRSASHTLAR